MRQEIAEYFCDNLEKNLTYFNRSEAFPLICLRDHTDNLCVYRDWIVMRILEIAINKTKKNNEE